MNPDTNTPTQPSSPVYPTEPQMDQPPPQMPQPISPMPPQSIAPQLPPQKSKKKLMMLVGLIVAILLLVGGVAWYVMRSSKTVVYKPAVTLYYNDGKTVLWQDNDPAVEPTTQPAHAPYFVDLVRAELQKKFGSHYYTQGAWNVTTTLDAGLQASAEELVATNLASITSKTNGLADEEATTLQDVTTGQIKALVGGTNRSDPDHGLINYTTTHFTPGSTVKPFDYAALIEGTTNTGAGTAVSDTQDPILPGYPCTIKALPKDGGNCLYNYDFLYAGAMPLRYALGGNRNVPAVKAAHTVGVQKVVDLIKNAGADNGYNCYSDAQLTQTSTCYDAAALGDGAFLTLADETHALSTLANGGKKVPQTTIQSVVLNGKTKLAWQNPTGQQIVKPDTAYIINDIMSDPNASYLPGSCDANNCTALSAGGYKFQRDNGWKFAVDDGTTNNGFDATMASWSSKYAVVSWVGNHARNVNVIQNGTSTEALIEPLTRGLMEAAHAGLSPVAWTQSKDIQTLPAYVLSSHIHLGDVEPSPTTDIYPGWYKP